MGSRRAAQATWRQSVAHKGTNKFAVVATPASNTYIIFNTSARLHTYTAEN